MLGTNKKKSRTQKTRRVLKSKRAGGVHFNPGMATSSTNLLLLGLHADNKVEDCSFATRDAKNTIKRLRFEPGRTRITTGSQSQEERRE